MDGSERNNLEWQAFAEASQAAIERRNWAEARQNLERARAATRSDWVKLHLLEADLLVSSGAEDEAEEALCRAQRLFPDSPWPLFKLAQLKQAAHRPQAARMFATQSRALDPNGENPHARVLLADLCLNAREMTGAAELVLELQAQAPGHAELQPLLTRLLSLIPDGFGHGGDEDFTLLSRLETAFGPHSKLSLPLLQALIKRGDEGAVEQMLLRLIKAGLVTPSLLWILFNRERHRTTPDTLLRLADAISAAEPNLAREFRIEALTEAGRFDEAVKEARIAIRTQTHPGHARQLAAALFGAGENAKALRYLRLSLRRWPVERDLISLGFHKGLSLGDLDLARSMLDRAQHVFSQQEQDDFALMLASQSGNLPEGTARFRALKARGLTLTQRALMAMLLFNKVDLRKLDEMLGQIGSPISEEDGPLHRAGRAGMHILELKLEQRDASDLMENPLEWCRANPDSTAAAIRLLDARAEDLRYAFDPEAGGIRKIFQYWPDDTVPEDIAARMQSWQGHEGFDYERLNHSAARALIRESFGKQWLQAFDMCREEVERVDFIRCCVLLIHGGIWADATSVLYGDPRHLLGQEGQLVLGRELLGGTVDTRVMAASPKHPVLVLTAKRMRQALMQRSADIDWNKTGAGQLLRACGQYLAQKPEAETSQGLRLIPSEEVAQIVDLHSDRPNPPSADAAGPEFWEAVIEGLTSGS